MNCDDYIAACQTALSGQLNSADADLLRRAYQYGQQAHLGQTRASGEEYFTAHCVPVSLKLTELGMSPSMIAGGLLHDTIEDTTTTYDDLKKNFGKDIADLVNGVSKLSKVKYRGNERYVDSLTKFLVSLVNDVRVVVMKLADRTHNLETLQYLPPEKRQRIARESIMIYAPLALRLGIGKMAQNINDLAFPYAYHDDYLKTKHVCDEFYSRSEKTIEKMYRKLLRELTTSLGYTPKIDRRLKGLYSLYKKLQRKDWNTDQIYDFIALRAIVGSTEDCYKAIGTIHQLWKPVPGRIKDYIALPKPNGYQSLHTAVFSGQGEVVEIQLRTQAMHDVNEYGIAAHSSYKQKQLSSDSLSSFTWLNDLQTAAREGGISEDYLHLLRTDFFQDRIFTLTPRGDVIDLPSGATVLDFAYAVHTDLGDHAVGAKVNGKYVGLKTSLQSESIIEIITDSKAKPSDKWLEYVQTSRARQKIKKRLKKSLSF